MNNHLKGRIIRHRGVSYLVLQDNDSATEWLQVKTVGPKPLVLRMRREDVLSCLSDQK
jgi:hypothetical protein